MGTLVITDHATNFRWVFCYKSKTEVPTLLIRLLKQLQRRFGSVVKELQTDQGTEFVNQDLIGYLLDQGIGFRRSTAYEHELNGKAEVSNYVLVAAARTLLKTANLSTWL